MDNQGLYSHIWALVQAAAVEAVLAALAGEPAVMVETAADMEAEVEAEVLPLTAQAYRELEVMAALLHASF